MKIDDRQIYRHLGWLLLIKIVALLALWWFFVADQRIDVDAQHMARQLGGRGSSVTGDSLDQ